MEGFDRFSSFILKNADIDDAIGFLRKLGVSDENIIHFEKLRIDDVRRIKDISEVRHDEKIAFVFGDVGFDAQNALLKLTEEPPQNTFFVFYKPDNILETIYSRCQVVSLEKKRTGLDKKFIDALNGDDGMLLKLLLSYESFSKEELLSFLDELLFYLSQNGMASKAEKVIDFLKTLREFNLNKRLLLFNIYLTLRGEHENSYC